MYSSQIYYDLAATSKMWLETIKELLEEDPGCEEAKELKKKYEEDYKMYIDIARQFDYEMGLA